MMDRVRGCSFTLIFLSLGIRSQTVVWILKNGHALPQNIPIMRHNYAHGAVAQTWCRGTRKAHECSYFPSVFGVFYNILRHFAFPPPNPIIHTFTPEYGKMRQISASKRSQNVVEIAKTDYCGFGQVFSFILSHPSISRHRERPCWHGSQQVC